MKSPRRLPLVDGCRALAALSIFAYHALFVTGNLTSRNYGWFLNVGVPLFYGISGLLLFRPFADAILSGRDRPVSSTYARHRLFRIIPAYWIALPIVTLVLERGPEVFTAKGAVTYFGFLQLYSLSTLDGGIGQAWTLCVEMSFYLFLPLFAWLCGVILGRRTSADRFGALASAVGLLIVLSLAWKILVVAHFGGDQAGALVPFLILPGALDQFAVGMLIAVLLAGRRSGAGASRLLTASSRLPDTGLVVAGVAYFALGWFGGLAPLRSGGSGSLGWGARDIGIHELKAVFALSLLVAAVTAVPGRGVTGRLLGAAPLARLGEISYGIYLWHLVLLIVFAGSIDMGGSVHWFGGDEGLIGGVPGVAAAFAATIALAAASWLLIERPLIARSHRPR